jgi:hypothetical protein
MQRKTALIPALGLAFMVSPPVYGQDSQPGPSPLPPSQTVTAAARLIAWSELQKPEPIQQHLAEPAGAEANQQPASRPKQIGPNVPGSSNCDGCNSGRKSGK